MTYKKMQQANSKLSNLQLDYNISKLVVTGLGGGVILISLGAGHTGDIWGWGDARETNKKLHGN